MSSMLVTECALAGRDSTQFLLDVCARRRAERPSMRQTDCMAQDAYRRGIFPVIKRD